MRFKSKPSKFSICLLIVIFLCILIPIARFGVRFIKDNFSDYGLISKPN